MAKCRLEVPPTFASAQPDPAWGSGGACNEGQLGWAGKGSTHMSERGGAHTNTMREKGARAVSERESTHTRYLREKERTQWARREYTHHVWGEKEHTHNIWGRKSTQTHSVWWRGSTNTISEGEGAQTISEGEEAHTRNVCERRGTHTISDKKRSTHTGCLREKEYAHRVWGEEGTHTHTFEGLLALHTLEKAGNSPLGLLGLQLRKKSSKQADSLPSLHPVLLDRQLNLSGGNLGQTWFIGISA